jgi:hypothetical protein
MKIRIKGVKQIKSFPAEAGPTHCARLFSGTGFSREEASPGTGDRGCRAMCVVMVGVGLREAVRGGRRTRSRLLKLLG